MGGPLIVVPVPALQHWGGCTDEGVIIGDGDQPDDHDGACQVEDRSPRCPRPWRSSWVKLVVAVVATPLISAALTFTL
ncbi:MULTISPECIES: Imm21 family immunity protein [unclassified Kitasatospora]|uniref:Imm21 family immunity protein n=1 Tax=unclassified Kitasatospora TaxID=2633591 RepID=UPI0009EA3E49|nr:MULTISPECIES: Imm21 family immunity protein [unclassified Kitasatospora]